MPGAPPIASPLKKRFDGLFDRHRLFGGRDVEIQHLDAFVREHRSGYLFVTGPSGYGKTAMLANWVQSLEQAGRPVCYGFINRVEGTADADFTFATLCQQLISAHALTGALPFTAVQLRSLYSALLRLPPPAHATPLVVVLDGLDEAVGWSPLADIFPQPLPHGVIVVASARDVSDYDWLANLGLAKGAADVLRVDSLDRPDVAHLLASAGDAAAQHASEANFVQALHDVSRGDPLYLRFLIEDVARGEVTRANIGRRPAGLDALLETWWTQLTQDVDISKAETYDLLGILAIARGPLRVQDLAGTSPTLRRGALINSELSGKLKRYLTGNPHAGFALSHARFAEFLTTRFLPEEIQHYASALLGYCARWREHKSPYALLYYPARLYELESHAELFALITREWMAAQFERTHSHRAFSGDVDLALSAALRTVTPETMVEIVRDSLVYASLGSLAANVPLEALVVAARAGQADLALAYVSLIPDLERQIEQLCQLAVALRSIAAPAAHAALGRALSLADALDAWSFSSAEPGRSGARTLVTVARALLESGEADAAVAMADRALALARSIPDDLPRAAVLVTVAEGLAHAKLVDQALAALEEVADDRERASATALVLRALVDVGRTEQAMTLCLATSAPFYRVPQLVALSDYLSRTGDQPHAQELVDVAIATARGAEARWYRGPLLAQAARAAAHAGVPAYARELSLEAGQAAERVGEPVDRAWALAGVVRGLAQADDVESARALLESFAGIDAGPSRRRAEGRALAEVALALARAGDGGAALALAPRAAELCVARHDSGTTPIESIPRA